MALFRKERKIDELDFKISRDDLLRRSRILIIDDERPDLIEDLTQGGFAVDYQPDITNTNMAVIERPIYDLIILDFGSVGRAFGSDEGLDLLRHIKRVNPSAVVFAYTSKYIGPEHADFYRSADGVLKKDAGIAETQEKIEDGLKQARSIQNLWSSMLNVAGIQASSKEDLEWQDLYVRGLTKQNKMRSLKEKVLKTVGGESGQQVSLSILEKIIEIGVKAYIGA
jgi:hypothetical protein